MVQCVVMNSLSSRRPQKDLKPHRPSTTGGSQRQSPLTYYPRYLFSQSPVYNQYSKLTAVDIFALRTIPGYEGKSSFGKSVLKPSWLTNFVLGQNIYFHLNHPIRWVRLVGIVVSFEEYDAPAKRVIIHSTYLLTRLCFLPR